MAENIKARQDIFAKCSLLASTSSCEKKQTYPAVLVSVGDRFHFSGAARRQHQAKTHLISPIASTDDRKKAHDDMQKKKTLAAAPSEWSF